MIVELKQQIGSFAEMINMMCSYYASVLVQSNPTVWATELYISTLDCSVEAAYEAILRAVQRDCIHRFVTTLIIILADRSSVIAGPAHTGVSEARWGAARLQLQKLLSAERYQVNRDASFCWNNLLSTRAINNALYCSQLHLNIEPGVIG